MKWYVDFNGWAVVEAETAEEAVTKFFRDEYDEINYGNDFDVEECSDDQAERFRAEHMENAPQSPQTSRSAFFQLDLRQWGAVARSRNHQATLQDMGALPLPFSATTSPAFTS